MPAFADLEALRATCRASRNSAAAAESRIARDVAEWKKDDPHSEIDPKNDRQEAAKAALTFPHVGTRKNSDGSVRYYFKRKGCPIVRLPDDPGSPEFISAYAAALGGFTLPGDDPLSPFLMMIFAALKHGDRDNAERIFVRMLTAAEVNQDHCVADIALRSALKMVGLRRPTIPTTDRAKEEDARPCAPPRRRF